MKGLATSSDGTGCGQVTVGGDLEVSGRKKRYRSSQPCGRSEGLEDYVHLKALCPRD